MSVQVPLKATGLLARKGEAAPAMLEAAFNDPGLAWAGECDHAPMTWENTPAAGLTPHRVARRPVAVPQDVLPVASQKPDAARPKGARHAFTARLPMPLYCRLKKESARTGRSMTHLVAEALGRVLEEG